MWRRRGDERGSGESRRRRIEELERLVEELKEEGQRTHRELMQALVELTELREQEKRIWQRESRTDE